MLEKVTITIEEYEVLKEKVKRLQKELEGIRTETKEASKESASDNLRTPGIQGSLSAEQRILEMLNNCQAILNRAVIKEKANTSQVDIGDIIKVSDALNGEEPFSMVIRLVSYLDSRTTDGIDNVSKDSPMGKAIYGKQVGDKGTFTTEQGIHNITILGKLTKEQALEEIAAIEEEEFGISSKR